MSAAKYATARLVVFFAAASLLLGCSVGGVRLCCEENIPVTTEVLLSEAKVRPGDPFDIVVTVKNSGDDLHLGFANQQQFGIRILGEDGAVYFRPLRVSPALSDLFIGADRSVSHSFQFSGTIDPDPADRLGHAPRRELVPGVYWVEAGLLEHREFKWGSAKLVVAR